MDHYLFEKLIESASQAAEIVRGDRTSSRTFELTSNTARETVKSRGLPRASGRPLGRAVGSRDQCSG